MLESLKVKIRLVIELIIQACIFVFAMLVMLVGGLRLVTITLALNQVSAALRIPLGYVYLVIPLSGLLIMYYSLASAAETVRKSREA